MEKIYILQAPLLFSRAWKKLEFQLALQTKNPLTFHSTVLALFSFWNWTVKQQLLPWHRQEENFIRRKAMAVKNTKVAVVKLHVSEPMTQWYLVQSSNQFIELSNELGAGQSSSNLICISWF